MLLSLLACGDDVLINRVPPDPDETAPLIQLDPAYLTFDALEIGEASTLPIVVTNVGATTLDVSELTITGTSAFAVVEEGGAELAPDESATYTIQFSPVNPEDIGTLEVASNDPFEPVVSAVLSGAAQVPELRVHPRPLEFGAVPLDCGLTLPLYLENVGTTDLVVTAIAAEDMAFEVDTSALPLTLAAGEQASLDATFRPTELADYSTSIYVASNDLTSFTAVNTTGSGGVDSAVEDAFQQGDQIYESTDILLYVDGSGSMNDDQENLANNFGSFVEALGEAALDWEMMVVTHDNGCHNGPIFNVENINTLDLLDAVRGPVGDWTEAGLTIAEAALERTTGCNANWMRSEARTTIILVSDEAEQSPAEPLEMVDNIQALAPTATIHAIAGDVPDGCSTASAGTGYDEASAATGGVFLSICDADWGEYFETIAERTASNQVDTFTLSAWPLPASIRVEVNRASASGWSYDGDQNAIVFAEEEWPPPSALIMVSYAIAAECGP